MNKPDTDAMTEAQKSRDYIKDKIDENLRLTSHIPYTNTPDTEYGSKSVEIWGGKETPKEIAHSIVTHFSDFISTKIESDMESVIERLLTSRDTYWKERVRESYQDKTNGF